MLLAVAHFSALVVAHPWPKATGVGRLHRRWRERGPVLDAAASGVAQAVLLGLGVVWLVHLDTTGRGSGGDLALGLVLLGSAVDDASGLGSAVGADLVTNTYAAQRYLWLLDYVPPCGQVHDHQPLPGIHALQVPGSRSSRRR